MSSASSGSVLKENFNLLEEKENAVRECRRAFLWDTAALLGEIGDPICPGEETLSRFHDLLEFLPPLGEDVKTDLCRILVSRAERLGDTPEKLLGRLLPSDLSEGEEEETDPGADDRICYLRSSYADTAYRRFAALLSDPKAFYQTSFGAVCEEIYYGRAGQCILPIESTREGTLMSFRRLIAKYDLKLAATVDVKTGEEETTRFGLFRKVPIAFSCGNAPLCLRFSFPMEESGELSRILAAMQTYRITLSHVDSLPTFFSETDTAFDVTAVCGKDCELSAFFCYLAFFTSRYTLLGLYPHLS